MCDDARYFEIIVLKLNVDVVAVANIGYRKRWCVNIFSSENLTYRRNRLSHNTQFNCVITIRFCFFQFYRWCYYVAVFPSNVRWIYLLCFTSETRNTCEEISTFSSDSLGIGFSLRWSRYNHIEECVLNNVEKQSLLPV